MGYAEELRNPVIVLGVRVDGPAAIIAALGSLGAGLALALQSIVENATIHGWFYDRDGIYSPNAAADSTLFGGSGVKGCEEPRGGSKGSSHIDILEP